MIKVFRLALVLFSFILLFSVSSAVAKICCWNMENITQTVEHSMPMDMEEDCHSESKDSTNQTDNSSKDTTGECCYKMMECQVQLFKISNDFSINQIAFEISYDTSPKKFISNIIEPLKHPPKVLL